MFCSCTEDLHCLVVLHPRSNHYKLYQDRKRKEQERFNFPIMTLFISPARGCSFKGASRAGPWPTARSSPPPSAAGPKLRVPAPKPNPQQVKAPSQGHGSHRNTPLPSSPCGKSLPPVHSFLPQFSLPSASSCRATDGDWRSASVRGVSPKQRRGRGRDRGHDPSTSTTALKQPRP